MCVRRCLYVNHEYSYLQIPDDEVLGSKIISGAQITDNDLCKVVEERNGSDLAHVRTVPQNHPDDHQQDHVARFNRECDCAATNMDIIG